MATCFFSFHNREATLYGWFLCFYGFRITKAFVLFGHRLHFLNDEPVESITAANIELHSDTLLRSV